MNSASNNKSTIRKSKKMGKLKSEVRLPHSSGAKESSKRWSFGAAILHLIAFSAIVFMSIQFVKYREFTFEATWLQSRRALNVAGPTEWRRLGAICNSVEQYECSVEIFSYLYSLYPNDTEVLSNLAMALTFSQKEREAFPYFKAYFSSGGRALDVMYWYGRALKNRGEIQDALIWFYNTVYYNPLDTDAAKEVIAALVELNRPIEALSFIASLIDHNRDDKSSELWLSEIRRMEQPLRNIAEAKLEEVSSKGTEEYEFKLPAIDGQRFFIPFKTKKDDFHFIVADDRTEDFWLSVEDLKFLGWNHQNVAKDRVVISEAQIGPLSLKNIEVNICDHCYSKVGVKFLSKLDARVDGRGKIPYLILPRSPL